jgi:hypothetical protein
MNTKTVGENQRYDLVVQGESEEFLRVQCKTGRLKDGAVVFATRSSSHGKKQHYRGQADPFGVYCPENGKVYLVPVEKTTVTEGRLRITRPKNNQSKGVVWAKEFEVGV